MRSTRFARILEKHGFHDYLLNAGGSSHVLSGFSSPGEPWRWAWSWEKEADGTPRGVHFEHPTGVPMALGVSGTHEQGAHLKDPQSGAAVVDLKSSLIGHPRATEADALSTALFVAGWDKTLPLLAKLSDKPAMAVINEEGVPRWNGFFQSLWGAPVSVFLFCFTFFFTAIARADDAVDLSADGNGRFHPLYFRSEQDLDPSALFVIYVSFASPQAKTANHNRKQSRNENWRE